MRRTREANRALTARARGAVAAAAVFALLLAGCTPPRDDDLFGMSVEIESTQPWARDAGLQRRLHRLVDESCAHVGLDPSMLYGLTLRIVDGGIRCGAIDGARGCTWREDGIIAVSTLAWISDQPPVPCVEDTPLPHELLHLKIADASHSDPRWESFEWWEPLHSRVAGPDCSGDPPNRVW